MLSADRDTALDQAEGHLIRRGIVTGGDVYVIPAESQWVRRAARIC